MRTVALVAALAVAGSASAHAGHDVEDVLEDAKQAVFEAPAAVSSAVTAPAKKIEHPPYSRPAGHGYFVEPFDDDVWSRWSPSHAVKGDKVGAGDEQFSYVGVWDVREPDVYPGLQGDKGLVVTNPAAHHAVSASIGTPVDPSEPLVVQYEVKLQKGLECGGAYLKLLTASSDTAEFSDKTPYSIMFGPDRCGATNKVHLILRHKSPKTGEIEEKHLRAPPAPKTGKTSALYTLVLDSAANTYEIKINGESAKSGSLLEDFDPPFVPPTEIDDPDDKKPDDWVEAAKIADPDAVKPADWDEDAPLEIPDLEATKPEGWLEDEPASIPDPEAVKPEEWDDDEDGDWIPPSVPNPKCETAPGCGPWVRPNKANPDYKGKWYAPLIDNPLYKGIWKAAKILNPAFFEDKHPLENVGKIGAIGFEIWSMQSDILFDNIFIGKSAADADAFAKASFHLKKPIEEAEEAAATPPPPKYDSDLGVDWKKDPVGFVRAKVEAFIEDALLDPLDAVKRHRPIAGVFAGLVAILITSLGLLVSAITGGSKAKPPSSKAKGKAVAKPAPVTQADSAAPVQATTSSIKTSDSAPVTRRKAKEAAAE